MNKIVTVIIIIIIGVIAIATIDTFSEGLMTDTETNIETFVDYEGNVTDLDLTKQITAFMSAVDDANEICVSNDQTMVGISYATTGDSFKMYVWNDTSSEFEVLDTFPDLSAYNSKQKFACAFSPDDSKFVLSVQDVAVDPLMYDVSGTTFTATSDTVPSIGGYTTAFKFLSNSMLIFGSNNTNQYNFGMRNLSGTSWNNNYLTVSDNGNTLDIDGYFDDVNYYSFVAQVDSPYLNIYKGSTALTLSATPSEAINSVNLSPDGSKILATSSSTVYLFDWESEDTTAITVPQDVTATNRDSVWLTDSIFYVLTNTGSTKYSYDSTVDEWSYESDLVFSAVSSKAVFLDERELVISTSNSVAEAYDVDYTITGDSVTLEFTPSVINSLTHDGVSKAYTVVGTSLTPTSPELSGDLVVNYDHIVTGEYPLLNIVPIIFAIVTIIMTVSFIYIKQD